MDRKRAIALILAEAFSESGLVFQMENGEPPNRERINNLIEMLAFLMDDLADEDAFSREFVSALFVLGKHVPDLIQMRSDDNETSRSLLDEQAEELTIAVTALIENWNHWPDLEAYEFSTNSFETSAWKSKKDVSPPEQVGGYCIDDITYCVVPNTMDCFPVRIVKLGNGYLDVSPLIGVDEGGSDFLKDEANRRFFYPKLSPGARFGGEDERLVNSNHKSGPELRLLPVHYATKTLNLIRERHAAAPDRWPLPTGLLFERWFQKPDGVEEP